MTIREMIAELERVAAQDLKGGDAEVILFDKTEERELHVDPDSDRFDFQVTRGDGEAVIEFD